MPRQLEVALHDRAVPSRPYARSVAQTGNARARRDISGPMKPQFGCGSSVPGGRRRPCRTPPEQRPVTHEREPALVGTLSHLWPSDDDRVGALDAVDEMLRPRRQRGEQPEGAVHVEPGAVPFGQVGHLVERVEVARVHLAGVGDHDRGSAVELARRVSIASRSTRPTSSRASLCTRCRADTEHPQRFDALGWM